MIQSKNINYYHIQFRSFQNDLNIIYANIYYNKANFQWLAILLAKNRLLSDDKIKNCCRKGVTAINIYVAITIER